MKHQLTGAFVLAALAVPLAAQAEGRIYGQFNISASEVENDQTAANALGAGNAQAARFGSIPQDGQSGDNNGSRLGFQGAQGQFFYAVELGLGTDGDRNGFTSGLGSTRHAFVGFNSSVGTFSFGRTNTAYKLAGQRVDPFYDTSAANFVGGFSPEGASYGLSNLINGWSDNSIAYISPEIAGFTLNAGGYLNVDKDVNHDFAVGLDYRWNDLAASVQYLDIGAEVGERSSVAGSGVVDTAIQAALHYQGRGWTLGGSYELVELRGSSDDRAYAYVGGTFDLGENLMLAASVGSVDQGAGEGEGFTVGAFVKLIEDFQLYGLFSMVDLDGVDNETQIFSVGVKYGFQI